MTWSPAGVDGRSSSGNLTADATGYAITGLDDNTAYTVTVKARNPQGDSAGVTATATTPEEIPLAVWFTGDTPKIVFRTTGNRGVRVFLQSSTSRTAAVACDIRADTATEEHSSRINCPPGTLVNIGQTGIGTTVSSEPIHELVFSDANDAETMWAISGPAYDNELVIRGTATNSGETADTEWTFHTDVGGPHFPKIAVSKGNGKIAVGWSPPTELGKSDNVLSGFRVWWRVQNTDGSWPTTWTKSSWLGADAREHEITGLTNDRNVQVRVRARAQSDFSGTMTQFKGMTTGSCPANQQVMCNATPASGATTAPGTPQSLSVAAGSDFGVLDVSWAAPSSAGDGIHLYRIEYKTTTDTTWTAMPVDGLSTSATITGLANGTAYNVRVRAEGAAGDSGYAATVNGTPRTVRLWLEGFEDNVRPRGDDLRVRADGDISATTFKQAGLFLVTVKTNLPASERSNLGAVNCTFTNLTSTSIQSRTSECPLDTLIRGVGGKRAAWIANNVGTFTGTRCGDDFQITASTTYTKGDVTFTVTSPAVSGTLCGPYIPVNALTRISVGNGRIGVAWSSAGRTEAGELAGKGRPNAVVNNAELEYRAVGETSWTSATIDINGGDNGIWYADTATGLTAGAAYEIRIRLRNNNAGIGGLNHWGLWHYRTTAEVKSAGSAPGAPGSRTATAGDAQIVVGWAAPTITSTGIAYYQVRHRTAGSSPGAWEVTTVLGNATDHTISGLTNGTAYNVQIRAGDANGNSAWTAIGTTHTPN